MDLTYIEVSRFFHAVAGSVALLGGLGAMLAVKGSRRHIQGGKVFAWLMVIAAASALSFMFYRLLPLAIVLAFATLYLVPSAILSFHRDWRAFTALNMTLMAVAGALALFSVLQLVRVYLGTGQFLVGPLAMALVFGSLFVSDWRMLAQRPEHPNYWIRRHLERMILAFAVGVMALVRIGTNFGLPFELSVILPLGAAAIAILMTYRRYSLASPASVVA